MKRFITFGSIKKFQDIVKEIQHAARYQGFDEVKQEPIYDRLAPLPSSIQAVATEKIHGTNAAVCFSNPDGFWVQSRKNIITPEKDNAGCAWSVEQAKDSWMNIIKVLATEYEIDLNKNIITVYFEWSGGNIQSKSAVSGLDKRAIIFKHFKVSPLEPQTNDAGQEQFAKWYTTKLVGPEKDVWVEVTDSNIFNIRNFPCYDIEINFNRPDIARNQLVDLVEKTIEPNSPVGKQFGIDGNVGEGVVVTFMYKDELYRFKVKGDEHSKSPVKKLTKVDSEKEQAKIDFANYATPGWRLEQMYQETFDTLNGGTGDIKKTGDFLRAVIGDVMKEESDELVKRGLEPKDVNGQISTIARMWFMEQLEREVGLC